MSARKRVHSFEGEAPPNKRQETSEEENKRQRGRPKKYSSDAERKRVRRASESESETRNRLDQELLRRRMSRTKLSSYRAAIDVSELPEKHYLGPMSVECIHCGAVFFSNERKKSSNEFNQCCNFGNIELPEINYPSELRRLLDGEGEDSNNFRANIRSYNNAFAMASLGAKIDPPPGHGPYCFRIHGQMYHAIDNLNPESGKDPSYAQLYILDPEEATDKRLTNAANRYCKKNIMIEIAAILNTTNPHIKMFKSMKEIADKEESEARQNNLPLPDIQMIFDLNKRFDKRRYNIPLTSEIAAVYVLKDDELPPSRSYAIHYRNGPIKYITETDPMCDPMTYPLLFPHGELGWHPELQKKPSLRKRTRVTQMEYYSYRISIRPNKYNAILRSGKLFQQYVVDSFVRMEQNRLNYDRTHQSELRADEYRTLVDYLAVDDNLNIGRRVILPATFPGSPRYMQALYQDSMAIVRRFGKPDYFITMTCNPNWKEIQENLLPHQTPVDRPDITTRVFAFKLKIFLDMIIKQGVLGKVVAFIWVIESQKRGLLHSHMLFNVADEDKPHTPEDVDKVVWAELPDPEQKPSLYRTISSYNMHNKCGESNPDAPCMDKETGKCSKRFAKRFIDHTSMDVDGFPEYRRRDNGITVDTPKGKLDNRWVVPYNPFLSSMFDCHINVEVCSTISKQARPRRRRGCKLVLLNLKLFQLLVGQHYCHQPISKQ